MAGHSHWAGIKHKKGRMDKQRSKIFSKISKEITVAAKLGSKDPKINSRLRSAIQMAKNVNMQKDNIQRAVNRSEINKSINYNSLTYEGFGPEKIAVIVETLTENKNRTASSLRNIFQKFGGSLGATGVASYQFRQAGIIRIDKKDFSENEMLEITINAGADDCLIYDLYYEIITSKEFFLDVKIKLENITKNFISSKIEWKPINKVFLKKDECKYVFDFLEMLEEDDDVQNVYTNFVYEDNETRIN